MLYWLAKWICCFFFNLKLIRIEVVGKENIIRNSGPLIIAPRHQDASDAAALIWAMPFTIRFMLKLDNNPISLFLLTLLLKTYSVSRTGVPLKGLRESRAILASGQPIGVFPEGHRTPVLIRAEKGVGYLIHKCGVPVVPVAITGTNQLLRHFWLEIPKAILRLRPPIRVVIGTPYIPTVNGRKEYQRVGDDIMLKIAADLPHEERGFYANPVG
jgi:1-acyl-sn-glycerol-3-phosphate acyltransferase